MTQEQKQATIERLEARLEQDINIVERRMLESLLEMFRGDTGE